LAAAFAEAGAAVHLVTTGYAGPAIRFFKRFLPLPLFRKLANRWHPAIQDKSVTSLLWAELLSRALQRVLGESLTQEWLSRRLTSAARAAISRLEPHVVVCYNYDAFAVFNALKFKTSIRKVIFQCHPHTLTIIDTFRASQERGLYPVRSVEKELSFSNGYQAELIAEPLLADLVLCASSFTRQSLIRGGVPRERIAVIPYGVAKNFGGRQRRHRSDPGAPLRLIFVGQFVYRKGLLGLARVLDALDFSVDIVVVGRGLSEVHLSDLITSHHHRIRELWDVSVEELAGLYAGADVFVFPSLIEGFAHVILEAMQAGCVPVVSSHTCAPDVIEWGVDGYYFPPDEIDAFVNCLSELRSSERLLAMSDAARLKSDRFAWSEFRKKVVLKCSE
jgi:glycosyltransferase involved in cell wall biosynthesis